MPEIISINNQLNQFREAIELCRNNLMNNSVKDDKTYYYAIIRLYSKMILICCEIYTLLISGYPEGAMALCRQLYEGLVLIDFLLTKQKENDQVTLERFFDAVEVSKYQQEYISASWAVGQTNDDMNIKKYRESVENKCDKYVKKYQKKNIMEFDDYWWTGYNKFGNLANKSNFKKQYHYKVFSNKLHMNVYGAFHYLNNKDYGILIGDTKEGLEEPLWYASLFLFITSGIIRDTFPTICPDETVEFLKETENNTNALKKNIKYGIDE